VAHNFLKKRIRGVPYLRPYGQFIGLPIAVHDESPLLGLTSIPTKFGVLILFLASPVLVAFCQMPSEQSLRVALYNIVACIVADAGKRDGIHLVVLAIAEQVAPKYYLS